MTNNEFYNTACLKQETLLRYLPPIGKAVNCANYHLQQPSTHCLRTVPRLGTLTDTFEKK